MRLTSDYVFSGGSGKESATTAQSAPLRVSYARYARFMLSAGATESATCRICAGQRRGGELPECVPGGRSRVSPRPVLQSTVRRSGAARGAQRLGSGGPVAPALSMRGRRNLGRGDRARGCLTAGLAPTRVSRGRHSVRRASAQRNSRLERDGGGLRPPTLGDGGAASCGVAPALEVVKARRPHPENLADRDSQRRARRGPLSP